MAAPTFRSPRARALAERDPAAAALIRRFVDGYPPLTDGQVDTLRRALPPLPETQAADRAA